MNSKLFLLLSILVITTTTLCIVKTNHKENFTADGWVFNKPPEWYNKSAYNPNDWYVAYYPEQLSQPGGCDMHYRGDNKELNWLSSAYRFWRM